MAKEAFHRFTRNIPWKNVIIGADEYVKGLFFAGVCVCVC